MKTIQPYHSQLPQLIRRYGNPVETQVLLNDSDVKPLSGPRVAEVCMVIRRHNGHILTARKHYYPPGITRLLTGGIEPGEAIEAALQREVHEETNLTVEIQQLIAVVTYAAAQAPQVPLFVSYAFLLNEVHGELRSNDPDEQLEQFLELRREMLPAIAQQLEQLPTQFSPAILGSWQAWGRFRSPLHRIVSEQLDRNT